MTTPDPDATSPSDPEAAIDPGEEEAPPPFNVPVPPGWRVQTVLAHADIAEWIGPMLARRNVWTAVWKGMAFGGLVLLGALGGWLATGADVGWGGLLLQVGLGLLLALLLVPVHEGLHALAYRGVGAPEVSFGADWRRLVFHCTAHGFVADLGAFRWVALLPFAVVTAAGLGVAALVPTEWVLLPLTVVAAHTTFCVGDFALLGYLHDHRDQEMTTADDVPSGTTGFFVRE